MKKIEALIEEYVKTLPDNNEVEWYASSKEFAEIELELFVDWLNAKGLKTK